MKGNLLCAKKKEREGGCLTGIAGNRDNSQKLARLNGCLAHQREETRTEGSL